MYIRYKLCPMENTHKPFVAEMKWEQALFIFIK